MNTWSDKTDLIQEVDMPVNSAELGSFVGDDADNTWPMFLRPLLKWYTNYYIKSGNKMFCFPPIYLFFLIKNT